MEIHDKNGQHAVNKKKKKQEQYCQYPVHKMVYMFCSGNGPSGICLSFMLAGNWPYYTGEPHPADEMLTARLHSSIRSGSDEEECCNTMSQQQQQQQLENETRCYRWHENGTVRSRKCQGRSEGRGLASSTRCKLECLSSGLEGRIGGRPLALLMDQLQHPCVDAGLDVPSLLTWKSVDQHPEHKVIDHIVLGKGQPGGSWQVMNTSQVAGQRLGLTRVLELLSTHETAGRL